MLKVFEAFSGIGAQAKALENISADFVIVGTSDWDLHCILAYALIHNRKINIDKFTDKSDEEIQLFLQSSGLSMDGKKPITASGLNRIPHKLKRAVYSAMKETNNLGSITNVYPENLPEPLDILTYSFPCQDLSNAGFWHKTQTGLMKTENSRSSMLWEIQRLLEDMHSQNRMMPRFLLMENVPSIIGNRYKKDFNIWKYYLEELGYTNQVYILNSKNFGIPQNRERCYMISVWTGSDETKKNFVQNYFFNHNLERVQGLGSNHKNLFLSDILKTNYEDEKYYIEALQTQANATVSRNKIYEDNDKLILNGKPDNSVVISTLTTKQDRNPNSGVIDVPFKIEGKTNWRYLTPRETFLFMGFDEEDYEIIEEFNQLVTPKKRKLYGVENYYKLTGNSIVVPVLEEIFRQIIDLSSQI